ncbi:MAG: ATP-dependent Clp protease adaptor ClpS [Cardiobacteriaceae bacterium]|nr:ATP-dependent Clp protease adaptor ClpS [Cardiobacteriaceae bacterium]
MTTALKATEAIKEKQKATEKLQPPAKYAVILHNDDYTTMEFVVDVLQRFFQKNLQEAEEIMLKVHNNGEGIAGIYPYEIAEMRVLQTEEYAYEHSQPLQVSLRKIED